MSELWQAAVMPALVALREPFTGEDIRVEVARRGYRAHHPNAWGAMVNTLIRQNVIEAVGHGRMRAVKSHARQTPLYQRVKVKGGA